MAASPAGISEATWLSWLGQCQAIHPGPAAADLVTQPAASGSNHRPGYHILAILSHQGSLLGMERFAKGHLMILNELLGTQIARPPSDSTFRLLLAQLDVDGFEALLQQWIAAQPGVSETVDTLICDGKTLRGSISKTASGAALFIAQISLYCNNLGVAIAQSTYASDTGSEIEALRRLLDRIELNGLLVQADALHANRSASSRCFCTPPGHGEHARREDRCAPWRRAPGQDLSRI
jgi:hypothetical protein